MNSQTPIKRVIQTNQILEYTNEIIKTDEDYYNDVLKFLNLIFSTNGNSILKLRINKIAINTTVFNYYNDLNELYNLKHRKFDIDKYDFDEIHEMDETLQLVKILVNNVLEKLNYKLIITKDKKLYIKSI